MTNHYLIFAKSAHSLIDIVQGNTLAEAIWNYMIGDKTEVVMNPDGTVIAWGESYPHVLAYIERWEKIQGEWQIRELPDWAWSDRYAQVFCGESSDGPQSMIDACLPKFRKRFPKAEAKAFVWYLKTGVLVTFYQEKNLNLKIMKRYLYNWTGKKEVIVEWKGDYEQLAAELDTRAYRSSPEGMSTATCAGVGF